MLLHRTAITPLTSCLTPGVHFNQPSLPLIPHPNDPSILLQQPKHPSRTTAMGRSPQSGILRREVASQRRGCPEWERAYRIWPKTCPNQVQPAIAPASVIESATLPNLSEPASRSPLTAIPRRKRLLGPLSGGQHAGRGSDNEDTEVRHPIDYIPGRQSVLRGTPVQTSLWSNGRPLADAAGTWALT